MSAPRNPGGRAHQKSRIEIRGEASFCPKKPSTTKPKQCVERRSARAEVFGCSGGSSSDPLSRGTGKSVGQDRRPDQTEPAKVESRKNLRRDNVARANKKRSAEGGREVDHLFIIIYNNAVPGVVPDHWSLFLQTEGKSGIVSDVTGGNPIYKYEERRSPDPTQSPRFGKRLYVGPVSDRAKYFATVQRVKIERPSTMTTGWNCQIWILDALQELNLDNIITDNMLFRAMGELSGELG